jgi:hypothetical protein
MLIRRACVYWIAAAVFGLAISFPLAGIYLATHSRQPPQETSSEPPAKESSDSNIRHIEKEPESIWHRWFGDPVALGTFALAIAAFWTATIAKTQVRLAREEFLATHRPELAVRALTWEMVEMDGGWTVNDDAVTFLLVNGGRNLCTIRESAISLRMTPLPAWAETGGENQLGPVEFAPGQFHLSRHEMTENEMFIVGARTLNDCYFCGIIVYEDRAAIRRRHVFNRVCRRGDDEFTRTGNPEHEYTD